MKRERATKSKNRLDQIASLETQNHLKSLQDEFEQEMQEKNRMQIEKQFERLVKESTLSKLQREMEEAELCELESFRLRDRSLELKHELEISKDICVWVFALYRRRS